MSRMCDIGSKGRSLVFPTPPGSTWVWILSIWREEMAQMLRSVASHVTQRPMTKTGFMVISATETPCLSAGCARSTPHILSPNGRRSFRFRITWFFWGTQDLFFGKRSRISQHHSLYCLLGGSTTEICSFLGALARTALNSSANEAEALYLSPVLLR